LSIQFLSQHDINTQRWNASIQKSFNGSVYNYSWYLEALDAEWGAFFDEDYSTVFPVFYKKRLGRYFGYLPDLCGPLGVISQKPISKEVLEVYLNLMNEKFISFKYHFNKYCKLPESDISIKTHKSFELDLIADYKKINSKYTVLANKYVDYARNEGYTVIYGISLHEFLGFMRNNIGTIADKWYTTIQIIISNAVRYRMGQTMAVYDATNELCGVALLLWGKNKVHLKLLVTTKDGFHEKAIYMMIDKYIQEKAGKNLILSIEEEYFFASHDIIRNLGTQECQSYLASKRIFGI
jgi:hypothetical protein